jgi:hypothetical protein
MPSLNLQCKLNIKNNTELIIHEDSPIVFPKLYAGTNTGQKLITSINGGLTWTDEGATGNGRILEFSEIENNKIFRTSQGVLMSSSLNILAGPFMYGIRSLWNGDTPYGNFLRMTAMSTVSIDIVDTIDGGDSFYVSTNMNGCATSYFIVGDNGVYGTGNGIYVSALGVYLILDKSQVFSTPSDPFNVGISVELDKVFLCNNKGEIYKGVSNSDYSWTFTNLGDKTGHGNGIVGILYNGVDYIWWTNNASEVYIGNIEASYNIISLDFTISFMCYSNGIYVAYDLDINHIYVSNDDCASWLDNGEPIGGDKLTCMSI